ncbi:Eukaryotic protein of unknown function (DUF1764) family protein [Cryptosporidium meleagridis]|uniref:DUF1764 family protein n=1 Tax=Cryptosporidium meleagridis TaxID=93969 RepID=A0A2P4YYH9_9CRYT|nr:Eukaryotic protein of unknown function (DUF1764) family protein [Cryptosporidium meleagridis]
MDSKKKKNLRSSNGDHKKNVVAKATGEINKIFETILNKKAGSKANSSARKQKNKLAKRIKKDNVIRNNTNKSLDINYGYVKPIRYLNDGLPVYRLEDINLGDGGGTPDCPFDCSCCF